MLQELAAAAGLSGADFLRQLLRARSKEVKLGQQGKLERLALVSLHEVASRSGMACAVVFTTSPDVPHMPRVVSGDRGPQPAVSSVLEAPTIGNVVAQGFLETLSPEEKAHVEARFPNQTATWLFNT